MADPALQPTATEASNPIPGGVPASQLSLLSGNLIRNGGFEEGLSGWKLSVARQRGYEAGVETDSSTAAEGSFSAKVTVQSAGGVPWRIRLKQTVVLDKNEVYRLSFYAKAEKPRTIKVIAQGNPKPWYVYGLGKNLNVSTEWERYTLIFETPGNEPKAELVWGPLAEPLREVGIDFDFGKEEGTVWIDAVELHKINISEVPVYVNFSKSVATNTLSLGVQLAHEIDSDGWLKPPQNWLNTPALREKARAANFKLVRVFVTRGLKICDKWNEKTGTCNYDWSLFDAVIDSIYEMGAEPLINIDRPPPGMKTDSAEEPPIWLPPKGFPSPKSFALYVQDIAEHVRERGWEVRYWEIWNEPQGIFFPDYENCDEEKLKAYVALYNEASRAILKVSPGALIGSDASDYRCFLNYFKLNAENVGFLSFHTYDAWGTWLHVPRGYLPNHQILTRATQTPHYKYSPREMRETWGEPIPIINSETNFNSAWRNGTDPRIQMDVGGVWYAEKLRWFVLEGVDYSIYYHFASNDSLRWRDGRTEGWGFGMFTLPDKARPPYLVQLDLGGNLGAGDVVYDSYSQYDDVVSVLAWRNNGDKIMLINKISRDIDVDLDILNSNISGMKVYRVFEGRAVPLENLRTVGDTFKIRMKGYSVVTIR